MKRLTNKTSIMGRKHDLAYGCASIWKKKLSKHYRYNLIEEAVDKLGQLEDIEEELGIDLITLFKALTKGIYIKDDNLIDHLTGLQLDFSLITNEYSFYCDYYIQYYRLKDYGKTWWLEKPKEKIENE